jgi:hypothetical protein
MAITCPKCGAQFDVTLFQFGHRVRCDCGAEIEYPGTGLRSGHVAQAAQHQDPLIQTACAAATQLVADLDRACQQTDQWKNQDLTDLLVEKALSTSLHTLAATGCWGEANRLPSAEFWRVAGPTLDVGVLQHQARFKPRGYAGDYQMLDWINTNYCCDHPLGRAFDRFFQRQAAPQAVRNRTRQTAASLAAHCIGAGDEEYEIVSVGSGPAADVYQALSSLTEQCRARVRVTLLDLDPEALEFAQQQLVPLLPPDAVRCVRENLFRLPQNRRADTLFGIPDFLICSGLFDYLDDAAAVAMLRHFWELLATNGLLVVWNFAPHNPTRAYMEWIGNWYLTYRTAVDFERLAAAANIPRDKLHVGSETIGVDLYLTARKPS